MSDDRVVGCEIMSNTARNIIVQDYLIIGIEWQVASYEVLFHHVVPVGGGQLVESVMKEIRFLDAGNQKAENKS